MAESATSEKIGKVRITRLKKSDAPEYSDGDEIENYLLKLFKDGLSDQKRIDILNKTVSWPIKYHLAYERKNLLGWYPFKNNSKVLEVGAGCGSVTESLIENKNITVTANELSERRALINAFRNSQSANLEIVVGNLSGYQPKVKFDYVVCVGVFEYAGTFIDSDHPYKDFLGIIKSFLKPSGILLLAIENQLGFKYLAGAKEDHTGNLFDGINDYPQKKQVRTFGKNELANRLEDAGYECYFYYPYPDYKLPTLIYSDDYYPGMKNINFPKALLPTPNPDQPRNYVFSEASFVNILERNNMFRQFSNSFLVEAKFHG